MSKAAKLICSASLSILLLTGSVLAGDAGPTPKSRIPRSPGTGTITQPKQDGSSKPVRTFGRAPVGRMGFMDALDLVLSNLSVYRLY